MSIQATNIQQSQNNKCPHGLPVGTCPICAGMGAGGSKDKNKPRKPGEMSYNECMAAWLKMQAAKKAKLNEDALRLENAKMQTRELNHQNKLKIIKNSLENYINKLNEIHKNLEVKSKIISFAFKIISNFIIKPVIKLAILITNTISFISNIISNTLRFINDISQKILTFAREIFTEIKEKIKESIKKSFEKAKKSLLTLLNLFCEQKEEENESEKNKKLKEIFKKIFNNKNDKVENKE